MSNYGLFELVGPDGPSKGWVDAAMTAVDVPTAPGTVLKVSAVVHPCDWLVHLFHSAPVMVLTSGLGPLSFEEYASNWLCTTPANWLNDQLDSYKADTVMRLEDQPWALIELLVSTGMKNAPASMVATVPKPAVDYPIWRPQLRDRLIKHEREFCRRYDYY